MRVSEHSPSRAEENPSRHRALGPQRGEPACRRERKKKVISSRLQAKVLTRNLLYDPNKNGDCTEPINVRVNAKQSSIGGEAHSGPLPRPHPGTARYGTTFRTSAAELDPFAASFHNTSPHSNLLWIEIVRGSFPIRDEQRQETCLLTLTASCATASWCTRNLQPVVESVVLFDRPHGRRYESLHDVGSRAAGDDSLRLRFAEPGSIAVAARDRN